MKVRFEIENVVPVWGRRFFIGCDRLRLMGGRVCFLDENDGDSTVWGN
ncbi:MAG: hypothetical protein GY768_25775 [Planctomycetaceae bacterium]|nr:hypothetical protein [Planctomycetaceae bacterium]